jgi:hypothetical protein
MRTFLRILLALFSAVATYCFTFWFGGALLDLANLPSWSSIAAAAIAAVLVGRYVWLQTQPLRAGLARSVFLGAIVTGAVAFSVGFFGPIIFTPSANQGPLLGLFITGPLGVVVGALGGAFYWFARKSRGAATGDDSAA